LALTVGGLLATARAEPPAWQISHRGATLWLLGSVHYLRADDHPLPELVDALYESAAGVVMELDLDDLDALDTQARLLAAATLPAEQSLRSVLGEGLWQSFDVEARELGLSLASLSRFEPWFVALTVLDLGLVRAGYGAEFGLEQHLLRRAVNDRREVLGLETLAQQIAIFDELDSTLQNELLEQTLAEIDTSPMLVAELVHAWRTGDLAALEAALQQDIGNRPVLHDAVVLRRNLRWASEIQRLLERGQPYLVVVGALHLVGPGSLVELLADEGYLVTRITEAPR
jgi:uncharacterized protein YbaP (TraB family)